MTTENEIFTSQVRDANGITLDIILTSLEAEVATANGAQNTVMVSANGGSTLASHSLNFVNTANVTVVVTDNGDGNANVYLYGSSSVPGGSNTFVQYNNNGQLGGTANLTYNAATNTLNANGAFNLNGVNVVSKLAAAYAAANGQGTFLSGSSVVANIANLNFLNSGTINVAAT